MSDELTTQTLSELAAMIRSRKVSAVEVVAAHLRRIERVNPALNAVVTLAPDALEQARRAEDALMRGEAVGPLHGVPVTIKDTIETKGLRTTAGSRVRADYVPERDAAAVARLRAAGAIILGKTNVAEMAASYDTVNPVFGQANNPYDLARTTGGSSGGEAAAIAACLSPAGLGSDLMGSIRVPAHFCGIVGLKPTTGSVPCTGHIPTSLGVVSLGAVMGPLARNVADAALMFDALAGFDVEETVCAPSPASVQKKELRGLRVGCYTFDGVAPVTSETRRAVSLAAQALADVGLVVIEARPPGIERAHALWTKLFARAALIEMRREYAGREEQAGAFIRYLLDSSKDAPGPAFDEFAEAWSERDRLRAALIEWMHLTPLLIAPVGATHAPPHGARKLEVEGQAIRPFRAFSYAQAFNVFGLPSVSVPAGRTPEGLPIGVQIIGRPFAEKSVLAAAALVEEASGGWRPAAPELSPDSHNPL